MWSIKWSGHSWMRRLLVNNDLIWEGSSHQMTSEVYGPLCCFFLFILWFMKVSQEGLKGHEGEGNDDRTFIFGWTILLSCSCLYLKLLVLSGMVSKWLMHYLYFLPCRYKYLLWSSLWSSRMNSSPLLFVLLFEKWIACRSRNSLHSLSDRWSDLISSLFNKDPLVTY